MLQILLIIGFPFSRQKWKIWSNNFTIEKCFNFGIVIGEADYIQHTTDVGLLPIDIVNLNVDLVALSFWLLLAFELLFGFSDFYYNFMIVQ